jgi:hypothetical protein
LLSFWIAFSALINSLFFGCLLPLMISRSYDTLRPKST